MDEQRRSLRISFVLASFALVGLLSMLGKPGVANTRAVDVVHLIGTGMCLGGALVALVLFLGGRRPG